VFTVTRSFPGTTTGTERAATIGWTTADGPVVGTTQAATAGSDYTAVTAGSFTYAVGDANTKSITVNVIGGQ